MRAHLDDLRTALGRLPEIEAEVDAAARAIARCLLDGGKVMAAGNGGSAAEAQHLTGELAGRLNADRERGPLATMALHADTSTLTALANDYGYDRVFARQVEALGKPGDALVVLSTSGSSGNLVAAVEAARASGVVTVGLLGGTRRRLHEICDHVLAVPAEQVGTIQECHLVLVHVLVELVEDTMTEGKEQP